MCDKTTCKDCPYDWNGRCMKRWDGLTTQNRNA